MTRFPEPPESPADEAPVVVPIGDSLDLHPFAPRDIPSVVDEYLREAHRRGFREVRIIHGRGQGVQRAVVRRVLRGHSLVVSFADAAPRPGAGGRRWSSSGARSSIEAWTLHRGAAVSGDA